MRPTIGILTAVLVLVASVLQKRPIQVSLPRQPASCWAMLIAAGFRLRAWDAPEK